MNTKLHKKKLVKVATFLVRVCLSGGHRHIYRRTEKVGRAGGGEEAERKLKHKNVPGRKRDERAGG